MASVAVENNMWPLESCWDDDHNLQGTVIERNMKNRWTFIGQLLPYVFPSSMRRRHERRLHFLETSYCGKWGENCNGKESCGNVQHLTVVNTRKKHAGHWKVLRLPSTLKTTAGKQALSPKNVPKKQPKNRPAIPSCGYYRSNWSIGVYLGPIYCLMSGCHCLPSNAAKKMIGNDRQRRRESPRTGSTFNLLINAQITGWSKDKSI